MDNCYPECHCIPIKLLKQIQKSKKILFELDLQQSQIIHTTNLKILASQLTILHLNSNQILDLNGIQNLPQLTYLDVSFNKLKSLSILNGMSQLHTLRATSNQLKNLDILNLPSIEFIDVSYNQIKIDDLFSRNFQSLSSLKAFSFLANLTKNYEQTLLTLCPQLQILDGLPTQ